jgi:hypothetical protein
MINRPLTSASNIVHMAQIAHAKCFFEFLDLVGLTKGKRSIDMIDYLYDTPVNSSSFSLSIYIYLLDICRAVLWHILAHGLEISPVPVDSLNNTRRGVSCPENTWFTIPAKFSIHPFKVCPITYATIVQLTSAPG